MLCFSPGRQLPLLTGQLCFSQEEKTPVEREPRGSPATPSSTPLRGRGNPPPRRSAEGREPTAQPVHGSGWAVRGTPAVPWGERTVAGSGPEHLLRALCPPGTGKRHESHRARGSDAARAHNPLAPGAQSPAAQAGCLQELPPPG